MTPAPASRFERVVLVHGFGADVDSHWFPWLARTVPSTHRVALPDATAPRASAWIPRVRAAIGTLDPDTAVVTHSLGGITAMRALLDLAPLGGRIGRLVLVAPFAWAIPAVGDQELDAFIARGFGDFAAGLDVAAAGDCAHRVTVIRSDADPLVPAEASDEVARAMGVRAVIVRGAGHFLAGDGVTSLPAVAEALGA